MVRGGSATGAGRMDGAVAPGTVIRDGVAAGTDVRALAIVAATLDVDMLDMDMPATGTRTTAMLHAAVTSMGTLFMVEAEATVEVDSTVAADSTAEAEAMVEGTAAKI
jgi:hypothetical protein